MSEGNRKSLRQEEGTEENTDVLEREKLEQQPQKRFATGRGVKNSRLSSRSWIEHIEEMNLGQRKADEEVEREKEAGLNRLSSEGKNRDQLRAAANRLETFHTRLLSERFNSLLTIP